MRRALLVVIVLGCQRGQAFHAPDPSLNRMLSQPRVDAFDAPMRTPPEGTIAISDAPWDPARETGMVSGAPVERIPLPVTRALLERGRARFESTCATCHGILGDGDSSAARNMPLRKPRSLLDDEVRSKKPGELFVIATRGFGLMPKLASVLERDDRWAVVAYVRALQLSQRAEVEKLPDEMKRALEVTP